MKAKNPAAVALGQMGKGVKRNFSPDERERRRKLMEKINDLRARRIALEKKVAKHITPTPPRKKKKEAK